MSNLETATQQTISFEHDRPIMGWIAAPMMVAVFTWAMYGDVFGHNQWAIGGRPAAVAVWLLFIGSSVWLLFKPRVVFTITPDCVVVRETWLLHSRESRYAKTEISDPEISGGGEDDFRCELVLSNDRYVTVGSSNSRKDVEELRARLLAALRPG